MTRHDQPMRARLASIPKTKRHDDGIQRDVKDPEKARQDYIDRLDAVPHVAALQRVVDGVWTQEQYDAWCKVRTGLPARRKRPRRNALRDDEDKAYEKAVAKFTREKYDRERYRSPEAKERRRVKAAEWRARKRAEGRTA